jgi:hypothetical protein
MGRRYRKNRQAKKPQAGERNQQKIVGKRISDEETEDFESPSTQSLMPAFYEVEQRASERLRGIVRMIDELLRV